MAITLTDAQFTMVPHTDPRVTIEAVRDSAPFKDWLASMDAEHFVVEHVHIQSVDMFGPRIGFMKFEATVKVGGTKIPGILFMRGGAVAVLPVLICDGKSYAVLTVQPRVPTGSFDFEEIPAGMLDGNGNFKSVATRELEEECGFTCLESDFIDLGQVTKGGRGIYLSPGGCDETIRVLALRKEVTADDLTRIQGKLTGLRDHGELITLKVVPLDELWTIPDAKTIMAMGLYWHLSTLPRKD